MPSDARSITPGDRSHRAFARALLIVASVWFLVGALVYLTFLQFNQGKFVYTLDDAYIHLAVAEEIAHGNYGINPDEICSPASSVIWPFLLAPCSRSPFFEETPLIFNIGLGFLLAAVVLRRVGRHLRLTSTSPWTLALVHAGATLGLLAACNALGLAFTGMEHLLQVLCVVTLVDAVVAARIDGDLRKWHLVALAVGPLVRYENLAIVGIVGLILLGTRWRKPATVALATGFAGLLLFTAFLVSHGLPALPSSVLVKSGSMGPGKDALSALADRLIESLTDGRGTIVLSLTLVAGCLAGLLGRKHPLIPLLLASAVAGAAHLCAGSYGWFHRYEAYVMAILLYGLLVAAILTPATARHPFRLVGLFGLACALLGFPYLRSIPDLPVASNNIYDQQYQLHRFVNERWKRPVAVNDIGWTAFHNDQEVLDLWGLASPAAARLRLSGVDRQWMQSLVRKHDIDLAMIYDVWFPELPATWVRVGELELGNRKVTAAGPMVSIFATRPEAAAEIEADLREFRPTLPNPRLLWIRGEPRQKLFGMVDSEPASRPDPAPSTDDDTSS